MIDKLLGDALQALRAARLLLDAGDTDGSINRSYYAVYYALTCPSDNVAARSRMFSSSRTSSVGRIEGRMR